MAAAPRRHGARKAEKSDFYVNLTELPRSDSGELYNVLQKRGNKARFGTIIAL